MKNNEKTSKLSIDITDMNKKLLEEARFKTQKPFGTIINDIIQLVLSPNIQSKKEVISFIKKELSYLYDKADCAKEMEKADIESQIHYYNDLTLFLNNGILFSKDEIKESEPILAKYQIKNGLAYLPKDWILLNPEDAINSENAIIVECRNNLDDIDIPHFVYFMTIDYEEFNTNFDKRLENEIKHMCCLKWERFIEVIEAQVEPIYDPTTKVLLNAEEHLACPYIGLFYLYVVGEMPDYSKRDIENLPYGAKIIRN